MKKLMYRSFLVVAATALIFTAGCKKDKTEPVADTDVSAASDNEQSETTANDVVNIADAAGAGQNSGFRVSADYSILGQCATVSRDSVMSGSVVTSRIITVNFGAANCICADGRSRRGKIIITISGGRYFDPGASKSIAFDGFYVNETHVEGSRTITNKGLNAAQNPYWEIAADLTFTKADGTKHTWKSARTREMIKGYNTLSSAADDEYSITGSADGTASNGNVYHAEIKTALVKAVACRWIQSGTVEISITGKLTRTIDFGNGTCDDQATVTINGQSKIITLH